jgi:capsular exopolysaccharide synthesis family protein
MVPSETEGLSLIPSGRIPPNPSELVGSKRMQALIDTLKEDYTVIIDAPPLLPVTDAGLLTAAADGCILVVHVGKTAKEQVKLCAKILERVNGKLLGSVLNMAPRRGIGAVVYGYGYGYTRYDQKYYYAEDGTRKRVRRSKKRAKRSVA